MEFRSIDGSGNNSSDIAMNSQGATFARLAPARFADGIGAMVEGPNPRAVSNIVVGEGEAAAPNAQGLSGMMYAWGQFIDHDLTRTASDGVTRIDIPVPADDPVLGGVIGMTRAVTDPATGTGTGNPRTAVDQVTGWLDASMVYGSDAETAAALRNADGTLRSSAGGNLPIVDGAFMAGDIRAAENPALTALQTLFLREHNDQVARLRAADPSLSGDQLYEMARAIVGAEIAHITYDEFLPHLYGEDALPEYQGYDPGVDARLTLEFVGAAWRWGHSTVSAETERKDELGELSGPGLELRDVFFMAPEDFVADSGADGFLRHLATDRAQAMDARIVEDLRNFLFDPPVGQDLAAINIQRGRDLGLPTLNQARIALGLEAYGDFAEITDDAATVAALRTAFSSPDEIDLWTGGLSESLVPGAFLGETFRAISLMQFAALRDGDRLWYENQGFDPATLAMIEETSLSDLILRHADTRWMQEDVFVFHERRAADAPAETPELPQLVIGTADGQTLEGWAADDMLVGRSGDQRLLGRGGDDRLMGHRGDDTLDAGAGEDRLKGGKGEDALHGGAGGDRLRGGAGDDHLRGGGGDDLLIGGGGRDRMEGGPGADRYRFKAAEDSRPDAPDAILGFTPGEDVIDLAAFGPLAWRGEDGFTAAGVAEARYVEGELLVDLQGDGAADMAILLQGSPAISEADLLA